MALIQWNDALSVRIDKFDNQHKKLISLMNDFHEAMSHGKGKEAISFVIVALLDYTKTHFKDEEEFLKKHNYSEFNAHYKEHIDFVNNVLDYKKQFETGALSIAVNVYSFLSTWLVQHIKKSDADYSRVLAGKPI